MNRNKRLRILNKAAKRPVRRVHKAVRKPVKKTTAKAKKKTMQTKPKAKQQSIAKFVRPMRAVPSTISAPLVHTTVESSLKLLWGGPTVKMLTTIGNGQCFFDSIRHLFHVPVATQREWLKKEVMEEDVSYMLLQWVDLYKSDIRSAEWGFMRTIAPLIERGQTATDEATQDACFGQAVQNFANAVAGPGFWGEHWSIGVVLRKLNEQAPPNTLFFLLLFSTNRKTGAIQGTFRASRDPKPGERLVYACLYYNGGHYQPLVFGNRMLWEESMLPDSVKRLCLPKFRQKNLKQ